MMSYYVYLSIQIYNITHQSLKPAHLTDLPEFSKIAWVPIVSAFALFALKR
jgi:hypothetical protein